MGSWRLLEAIGNGLRNVLESGRLYLGTLPGALP